MKPLNPFRQSTFMCGPASLKILLSHYGKHFSEQELAALCSSTIEDGTTIDGLVDGIRKLGYAPVTKKDATFEDIRAYIAQEIPVIVAWFKVDYHHISVVYDITDTHIFLMDPEEENGMTTMPLTAFEPLWEDYDSFTKVITPKWLLVVPELTSPR